MMTSNEGLSHFTSLNEVPISCEDNVSDEGLMRLTKLRTATIDAYELGDLNTHRSLTKLTNLTDLSLRNSSVLAITADAVASLPKLRTIDILCESEFFD